MLFKWTGNPWVDGGLAVIVAKSGKEKIEDFTDKDFETIVSDGAWLAKANRQLKAFTMVVGINSPLTNTSSNPSLKKENRNKKLNPLEDTGFQQYCEVIKELKESAIKQINGKFACEACGERPATDVLEKHNKEIARDWFPLAGSIGSDAQALPAASRTARICSLCLLSVQFLPMGAIIIEGKIACFQSSHSELTQMIIGEIYNETINKLQLLNAGEKLSAIGQGKGTKEALIMLIKIMAELQRNKRMLELPRHTSLNIWLFSNSGQEPDCEVIEIPNEALTFLWDAAKNYRQEIETFLRNEPKRIDFQLLECVKRKSEYYGFYPYKNSKPASKGLFELYQTRVLGNSSSALNLAEWFAYQIKLRLSAGDKNDNKLLGKLLKENAYGNKDKTILSKLKGILAQFAEEGLLTLEDYTMLFPRKEESHSFSVKNNAFKWIWFYINHEAINNTKQEGGDKLFTHSLIKTFARDTFDFYQKERGIKFIKRNILEAFKKGEVVTYDLQRWFVNLAEIKDGYTNEAWDDLCRDENGNNVTYEVRFQFRLEMANLYRLAVNQNKKIQEGEIK
ncbi:MAG: hypothetical protein HZA06_00315 [Nitrospirae bacterium]|nr:hypothetical protein [Nitrospirota bacterium]